MQTQNDPRNKPRSYAWFVALGACAVIFSGLRFGSYAGQGYLLAEAQARYFYGLKTGKDVVELVTHEEFSEILPENDRSLKAVAEILRQLREKKLKDAVNVFTAARLERARHLPRLAHSELSSLIEKFASSRAEEITDEEIASAAEQCHFILMYYAKARIDASSAYAYALAKPIFESRGLQLPALKSLYLEAPAWVKMLPLDTPVLDS